MSRIAKNKKLLSSFSPIEPLERRTLMSVAGATLIGPTGAGITWDYESIVNGAVAGTSIATSEGSTTFNGVTTGDRKTVSTSNTSGYTVTSHSYDGTTSDGIVEYGSTDSTTNSSGGVVSSYTDTNSPPDLVLPTTLVAGTVYTSNYTDTTHDNTTTSTATDTTESETDTVELTSDTTQSVTVPAGTYDCYVLTFTSTSSSEGSSSTTSTSTEYLAANVGFVKTTGGSGSDTYEEDLTSFSGGSGGGGGGGGTTGGGGGTTTTSGSVTPLVLKTSLPASVVSGSTTHGSATVSLSNTTSAKIKESVTTEVFASQDGAVDSASIQLGTITKTVSVNAGKSANISVSIKSIPASLNGTYTILASATDSVGTSSSTTGPSLLAAAPFVSFSNQVLTTNLTGSVVSGSKTKDTATLTLTNIGNVTSTGSTSVDLLVSPDGTVASGTAIRTFSQSIVLQPGKSKTVKFALQTLPSVANNNYYIVAELTDPKGDVTSVATSTTVQLAQPYVVLTPVLSLVTAGAKGTGSVSLTITNNGNYVPKGSAAIVLYASATTSINGATQLLTGKSALPQPGKSRTIKYHLTAAEMTTLLANGQLVVSVTDPLGGVLTAFTAG